MNKRIMPLIDETLCNLCGDCVSACPVGAVRIEAQRLLLDETRCAYCGDCEDICPQGAVSLPYEIIISPPQDE